MKISSASENNQESWEHVKTSVKALKIYQRMRNFKAKIPEKKERRLLQPALGSAFPLGHLLIPGTAFR